MTWEIREVPFEVKNFDEPSEGNDFYTFDGYMSIFHVEDRVNDIVEPGAFKKTIREHNGNFPLFFAHNLDMSNLLGGVNIEEDKKGAHIKARMPKDVPASRDAFRFLKMGILDGMSYSYKVIKRAYNESGVRLLRELAVGEVTLGSKSMVALPETSVGNVKMYNGEFAELAAFINGELKSLSDFVESKIWEDEKGWTEIKYRVRNPDLFSKVRQLWKANDIRALGGPLIAGGKIKIQALRFQKPRWRLAKAKQWVADHEDTLKSLSDWRGADKQNSCEPTLISEPSLRLWEAAYQMDKIIKEVCR